LAVSGGTNVAYVHGMNAASHPSNKECKPKRHLNQQAEAYSNAILDNGFPLLFGASQIVLPMVLKLQMIVFPELFLLEGVLFRDFILDPFAEIVEQRGTVVVEVLGGDAARHPVVLF
jgi:hypothetical protein